MNFNKSEDFFLNNIDKSIKKKENDPLFDDVLLNHLNDRLRYEHSLKKPKEEDFVDVHGRDSVEKDLKFVEGKQKEHYWGNDAELEQKKLAADVFENIIVDQIEKSAWLGRNTDIIPTSKYDDFVNHVDAVATINFGQENSSHLGLAMDVTFSKNENAINKKLDIIKKNIEKGFAPAQVKYFQDKDGNKRKINIPKVVVGANADTVRDLVKITKDLYSNDERVWKSAEDKMNFHTFQTKFLLEIQAQLSGFESYARKLGQEKSMKSYAIARHLVEDIIKSKTLIEEQRNHPDIINDGVYQNIIDYMNKLK